MQTIARCLTLHRVLTKSFGAQSNVFKFMTPIPKKKSLSQCHSLYFVHSLTEKLKLIRIVSEPFYRLCHLIVLAFCNRTSNGKLNVWKLCLHYLWMLLKHKKSPSRDKFRPAKHFYNSFKDI